MDALPAGNREISAFTDFFRDFGLLDGLVVVVESDEPSPDVLIEAVESLGERLAASPYLESVDFNVFRSNARFLSGHFPVYLDREGVETLSRRLTPAGIRAQVRRNLETLRSPFASPLDGDMVRRDPLGLREIVRDGMLRRVAAPGMDLWTGYYLGFQVGIGPEEEVRQGKHSQHDDHEVRNDPEITQGINDTPFEEGGIPRQPQTVFVRSPRLQNAHREQGPAGKPKQPYVESEKGEFEEPSLL